MNLFLAALACLLVFALVLIAALRRMRKLDERESPYIGEFRPSYEIKPTTPWEHS